MQVAQIVGPDVTPKVLDLMLTEISNFANSYTGDKNISWWTEISFYSFNLKPSSMYVWRIMMQLCSPAYTIDRW